MVVTASCWTVVGGVVSVAVGAVSVVFEEAEVLVTSLGVMVSPDVTTMPSVVLVTLAALAVPLRVMISAGWITLIES